MNRIQKSVLVLAPTWLLVVLGLCGRLSETTISTIGGASQLVGVGFVILALSAAHGAFGEGTLTVQVGRTIKQTFRRLTSRFRKPAEHSIVGSVTIGAHPEAETRFTAHLDPAKQTDERLAALERAVTGLRDEVGSFKDRTREAHHEIREAVTEEQQAREQGDERLRTRVRELALGNTTIDLAGLALFVQGIVLATWAPWIENLFG